MAKYHDLTGLKFGYLTVVDRSENGNFGQIRWNCICDCGTKNTVSSMSLKAGKSRSCGCKHREMMRSRRKHGQSHRNLTPEYSIWAGIIQRCTNPNNSAYKHYGKRGIEVDPLWRNDFESFYKDMGPRPSPEHSIDRINNSKGYCKENCRWATHAEQMRNLRSNNEFGHPGISYNIRKKKYHARITVNNRTVHLGNHKTVEEAIEARKNAESIYWGKSS